MVKRKLLRKRNVVAAVLLIVFALGFMVPEDSVIPVSGASAKDWNSNTFWYEPWGSSGVHKGVDIFSGQGTPVISSSHMLVLYSGEIAKGGKVVLALGPKWRLHYFAHLDEIFTDRKIKLSGEKIGTVGTTGNAKGKPAHLHYSIVSLLPLFWKIDTSTQGYKKAFYLDPTEYFK